MKRFGLAAAAILLVATSVVGLTAYVINLPTTLQVAVSQNTDLKLMQVMGQVFARNRESIRLKIVPQEGTAASAAQLEKGITELAVVRSDVAMPANAQTIAILHRNAGIFVAPSTSELRSVSQLAGRTIGIVRGSPANNRLLDTILAQYEVLPGSVRRLNLKPGDVLEAMRAGRIDLIFVVGSPVGSLVSEMVTSATEAAGGSPFFLPVGEAEAISKRMPVFESIEVLRGLFGGTPPKPSEKFVTLGLTYRLVASDKLPDAVAGELARLIFTLKPALVQEVASANLIEPPSTEKGAGPPVHPGAAAYLDGEQQSFFDRYGDYFYLGLIGFSMVGSGFAALLSRTMSRTQARDRERIDGLTQRLVAIMRATRTAQDDARLDDYQQEIDEIFTITLNAASDDRMQDGQLAAFSLAIDQVRRALQESRALLHKASPANQGGSRMLGPAAPVPASSLLAQSLDQPAAKALRPVA